MRRVPSVLWSAFPIDPSPTTPQSALHHAA